MTHNSTLTPSEPIQLEPGDHIISVNGEDVKEAPRDHVIQLVRACESKVTLVVCQPTIGTMGRKSTFLSAGKKAKLRTRPSRVRFAESVCVNGAPLFPVSSGQHDRGMGGFNCDRMAGGWEENRYIGLVNRNGMNAMGMGIRVMDM